MERQIYHLIIVCLCLLTGTAVAFAKDVPGIYTRATIEHWDKIFEPWVKQLYIQAIEPSLSAKAKKILQNKKIVVSTTKESSNPFYYYSHSRSIIIPVLSIKFLYDLIISRLWLESHGFEDTTLLYVSVLKYQDASAFPNNCYMPPFDALGVSHNEFMEITNFDPVKIRAFQQSFNGALLFILAHEVYHIIQKYDYASSSKQQTSIQCEAEADLFAFETLVRNQFSPAGVTWLFEYLSVWVQNAADFETTTSYIDWLSKESHPFTGWRLKIIGDRLVYDPHHFYPNIPDYDPRITIIKLIGSRIVDIGNDLDNLTNRRALRDIALDIKITNLAIHNKRNKHIYLPKIDLQ